MEAKDQPALHLLFYQIKSKTLQYTWQNDPNSTLSLECERGTGRGRRRPALSSLYILFQVYEQLK